MKSLIKSLLTSINHNSKIVFKYCYTGKENCPVELNAKVKSDKKDRYCWAFLQIYKEEIEGKNSAYKIDLCSGKITHWPPLVNPFII